ncbi:hypothetical protein, partial [Dickeya chrysanthemi]|uniref:hypothetical protein n=1 Tax=Dickeya chrysanthemi TaxID=556 RepID=UPI001EE69275
IVLNRYLISQSSQRESPSVFASHSILLLPLTTLCKESDGKSSGWRCIRHGTTIRVKKNRHQGGKNKIRR